MRLSNFTFLLWASLCLLCSGIGCSNSSTYETVVEPSAARPIRKEPEEPDVRSFVVVQPFGRLARRERFDGVGGDAFPERGGEGVHGFPEHLSRIRSLEGDDRQ